MIILCTISPRYFSSAKCVDLHHFTDESSLRNVWKLVANTSHNVYCATSNPSALSLSGCYQPDCKGYMFTNKRTKRCGFELRHTQDFKNKKVTSIASSNLPPSKTTITSNLKEQINYIQVDCKDSEIKPTAL
jgi:hypothetical protein